MDGQSRNHSRNATNGVGQLMARYVENPPDPQSLMASARSFGNYDLAGALADLIDNSLKARARNVELLCLFNNGNPEVRVSDDGHGMSESELCAAMRPASQNPLRERSPDDLGRFGWGMKSASFSQCTRLTVISTKDGKSSGAVWDLESLDRWRMGVLSKAEITEIAPRCVVQESGTEVIWNNCDRLSEKGSMSQTDFNALVAHTKNRLALTFHRYLSGEVPRKKLTMSLNGQSVDPYDPFFSHHDATQAFPPERITVNTREIVVRPYILPHFSKLRATDHEKLGGEEGFLKNQGFYVYRNYRLIIRGTWFRLARFAEFTQLVRIQIDIPNTLDELWKITVDKSDAQLPAILRTPLRRHIERIRDRSSRVHSSKGGRISTHSKVAVWERYARSGTVNYHINRDHPIIATLLDSSDTKIRAAAETALLAIEQGFPVIAFGNDTLDSDTEIHQTETQAANFRLFLDAAIPRLLAKAGGDFEQLRDTLKKTEPFSSHWLAVDDYLASKGWNDVKP